MKRFTGCYVNSGPIDPAEFKAVMFALGVCFLFIGFLTVAHRLAPGNRRPIEHTRISQASTLPPRPIENSPVLEVPAPPQAPMELNPRFRSVPRNFEHVDFKTRSYGKYWLSDGEEVDLSLIDGQYRNVGASSHWFDFNDVYFTDLTGDGRPEAIVMLSHLECRGACDGGRNLIYIYEANYLIDSFKEILKYETGSGIDGCSLKTLTVKNRRLSLELFGKCPEVIGHFNDPVKRGAYDVTRLDFAFDGALLVQKKKTVFTVPDCHEVSYGPEIRIEDERSPAADTRLQAKGPCA